MAQLGKYGIFQPNWLTSEVGRILCTYIPYACKLGIELIADVDPSVDDLDRLSVLVTHYPGGTSVNNILHWKQEVQASGNFQKYDYGAELNQKIYNQTTPPKYNPSLITEDVALFIGTGDELADPTDAAKFYSDMVNAKKEIHVYDIGHFTFLIGKTLPFMDDLIKFLDLPQQKEKLFLEILVD